MTYSIRTKDGIVIPDIPDDMPKNDPSLQARVAEIRASKGSQLQLPIIPVTPNKDPVNYNPYSETTRAAVGQGLLMGFGDELEAGLRSGSISGKEYLKIRNDLRAKQEAFQQEYPVIGTGSEIIGGLALPVGAIGLGAKGAIKGAQSLLKTGAKGVGIGGATGAVTGVGVAPEMSDVQDYATNYGVGGSIIGGAGVPAASIIGKTARNIYQGLGGGNADKIAIRKLSETLQKENLTPQQVQMKLVELRESGVPEATIADIGANLQKLGYGSYVVPSTAKTATEKFLQERSASLPNQLVEGLTEKSGSQSKKFGYDYITNLIKQQDDAAKIAYPKAHTQSIPAAPFQKYATRDVFKKAYSEAQKKADVEGLMLPDLEVLMTNKTVPTSLLHEIKIGLDRVIEAETDKITNKMTGYGADVNRVKKEFNSLIKNNNPEYAKANKAFADSSEIQRAFNTGNDYLKLSEGEMVATLKAMKPAEREAFRTGLISKVKDNLSDFEGVDFTKKVFGSDKKRAALKYAFDDPNQFNQFVKQVEGQKQLVQTNRKVLGGSPTAENALAIQDANNFQDLTSLASGDISGFLSNLGRRGIAQATGINPKVSSSLQTKLFNANPQEQYSILKEIEAMRKNQSMFKNPSLYQFGAGTLPSLLGND